MRLLVLATLFIFVSACGVDNNNHGYGFEIDGVTLMGIEYRGNTLTPFQLDNEFKKVYQCIADQWTDQLSEDHDGRSFNVDFRVFFVEQIENVIQGRFYRKNNLILLLKYESPYYQSNSIYIYRHELIHYILYKLNGDSDHHHNSSLFNTCIYIYY